MSKPTIAILSIGQMGLGIASLLIANDYRVITNVSDRSKATQDRAKSANIKCVGRDEDLVQQADYIFSIVPPRDAVTTAHRIETALQHSTTPKQIWYADLNAISPETARSIYKIFASSTAAQTITFIDGAIIGNPPTLAQTGTWTKPGIPISGPHSVPSEHEHVFALLNMQHISDEIGAASGLKCCFAALTKGFTALALQSYTTAAKLGVLEPLTGYMDAYNAGARARAEKGIVGCTGKAYRWVEEMNQIGECFAREGGFREQARVFREIAGVFDGLADVVGREGTGGMGDAEGVVRVLGASLGKEDEGMKTSKQG